MNTTERVLTLLALLQSRPVWSGTELSPSPRRHHQDGASAATLARACRDLGYPVLDRARTLSAATSSVRAGRCHRCC